ncbi:MAG TPA: threonine--tRNA ligase [Myxococcota bacterium]|nr:threonine--tRNA ligase [Myxococcota bacterium]HRY94027.1 threonine--tRNA ligase [Myxococcota bacterium]
MAADPAITLRLPDGKPLPMPKGSTLLEVAKAIGARLAKDAIAAKLDGRIVDLSERVQSDAQVAILTPQSPEGLAVIRHSAAHVMASAVKQLFPGALVTIGPAVDDGVNGFYYDFDFDRGFTEEDVAKITARMEEIIRQDVPFARSEVSRDEAQARFAAQGESYKLELLEAIPAGEQVSLYQHGEFVDLCRGPHLPSTGRIPAFKLMSVAGAYWRGDSKRKMLARIYGNAFASKKDLEAHLSLLEEARRRDHRLLGKQLDLFSFSPSVGGGLVLWHPKGAQVRYLIEDFWRQTHFDYGYELVNTPHIGRAELWQTSGHLGFYKDNMYAPMEIEGNPFYLKPMNCPFHIEIYKSALRSYRDMPIRFAELGTVYRYEASGVLHGLMRVRGFTQDDAHIFCRPDQLDREIRRCLQHTFFLLRAFGFDKFDIYLSTRPEKFVGEPADWERAQEALRSAMQAEGLEFKIDPGEGVFYGPKIDIKIHDSLGRSWQCTTVQVDFNLPRRFEVEYVDQNNTRVQPFMVHRALLGSIERFFGVLLEHHAGRFPAWLAPVQAVVLPVTRDQQAYAQKVQAAFRAAGLRVQLDDRSEKLGFRIREAQLAKVPFMLVVGQREVEQGGVSPRAGGGEDLGFMSLDEAIGRLSREAARPARPVVEEV